MQFVVEFSLPRAVTQERMRSIGRSSLGLWMVLGRDRTPRAIVEEYVVKTKSIIFRLRIIDDELMEIITTGEPSDEYTWINPIQGMLEDYH